jgi:hypothetical protein
MANAVVGGITNSVAVGGAVRATVKNAMAHSGIASRRWNTSAIPYLLGGILDESPTGAPTVSATRDVPILTRGQVTVCALVHKASGLCIREQRNLRPEPTLET